jgi:hypothetical protein
MTIGTITRTQKCATCGMNVVPGNHVCERARIINAAPVGAGGGAGVGGPPAPRMLTLAERQAKQQADNAARALARKLILGGYKNANSLAVALRSDAALAPYRVALENFAPKWDAVRNAFEDKGGAKLPIDADKITLPSLAAMSPGDRMDLINTMWLDMLVVCDCDTAVSAMVDPWIADPVTPARGFEWLSGLANPWTRHGYGFRCDTRAPDKTLDQGFKRAWTLNVPLGMRGTSAHDAIIGRGMRPKVFMWKSNRDAVSENNICVSRTLRGCTKFPNPDHVGDAYVYAMKIPLEMKGFDTEKWQGGIGNTALWQPGEKAFLELPAHTVIGSLKITKAKPQSAGECHRFTLPPHGFTWHGAKAEDRQRITAELDALRQLGDTQVVMMDEDFAP